jgi:NAD(P)-dependent dehydrogenase (short-subunit alcohol dehydrogenase family)
MPGPFLTDISQAWDFADGENPFGHSALQRAGKPAEIIGAALLLMSDAASFTTGSILRADGGIP